MKPEFTIKRFENFCRDSLLVNLVLDKTIQQAFSLEKDINFAYFLIRTPRELQLMILFKRRIAWDLGHEPPFHSTHRQFKFLDKKGDIWAACQRICPDFWYNFLKLVTEV